MVLGSGVSSGSVSYVFRCVRSETNRFHFYEKFAILSTIRKPLLIDSRLLDWIAVIKDPINLFPKTCDRLGACVDLNVAEYFEALVKDAV